MSTGFLFADFVIVVIAGSIAAALYYGLIVQVAAWWRPDVYGNPFGDVPNLPRRDQ